MIVAVYLVISVKLVVGLDWEWINKEMDNKLRTCRTNEDSCVDVGRELINPSGVIGFEDFGTANCFCDDECRRYGDCCLDKATNESDKGDFEDVGEWKCEEISDSPKVEFVYTLSTCPTGWKDEDVGNRCTKNVDFEDYSYHLDVPVLSLSTNRVYSNIYCAECHDDIDNLADMELSVSCATNFSKCAVKLQNALYRPKRRQWASEDNFSAYFSMPQLLRENPFRIKHKIRQCRLVVNECDEDWPNLNDNDKCKAFSSYISYKVDDNDDFGLYENPIFNNPFCAVCNNADMSTGECVMKPTGTHQPRIEGSFSLLMDFSDLHQSKVGIKRKCPVGQLFDKIYNRCVDFPCGSLFEKSNGVCVVKQRENHTDTRNGEVAPPSLNFLNDSCPKLVIPIEDYRLLPNESIFLPSTDDIYDVGHYEINDDHILICASEENLSESKFSAMQSTLSLVVLTLSVLCLGAHIAIHCSISKLRNLPGKNLLSLSVMLFCGQILFFGVTRIRNGGFCEFIAVLMHFSFLSAFFWMNILAVDICRTFTALQRRAATSDKNYKRYATYAWGFSAFIVGCSIIVDNSNIFPSIRPNYGTTICWISQRQGLLVFFAVPLAILLIENIVFFVLTARGIYRSNQASQLVNRGKDKLRFFLYVKLALIMGLTWIIGFVAALAQYDPLWYGFVILNGLQGTFIFFAFSVKKKVFLLLKDKFTEPSKDGKSGKGKGKRHTNLNTTTTTKLSLSNLNVNAV